jgi:hypothetical protein
MKSPRRIMLAASPFFRIPRYVLYPTRVSGYGCHSGKHPPATQEGNMYQRVLVVLIRLRPAVSTLTILVGRRYGFIRTLQTPCRCTVAPTIVRPRLNIANDLKLVLNDTLSETTANTATYATATETPTTSWIPVEGLYGIYSIPSGKLAIWI